MSFDERLQWLLIGAAVGFILGYIVRSLRDIKEELDEVDETVKKLDEGGWTRPQLILDTILLFVVVMTVWASFQTSVVNSRLNATVDCIESYNLHQSVALTSRDSGVRDGLRSEISLWSQYNELYEKAQKNPKNIPSAQKALHRAINKHRLNLERILKTSENYPYATPNFLDVCNAKE